MIRLFTTYKWIYFIGLIILVFCQSINLKAQPKTLPYVCGWDNITQQAEWTVHQVKSTKYFSWSDNSYLSHDYPVGNPGTDTVEDWIVSPALNVTGKSVISFSTNVYIIFTKQPTDYFGVWYSKKSSDPKSGDFKELANLTSFASTNFNYWHDTAGILLNDSGAAVYIAFKYGETDNWFTIKVDTLLVKGIHTAGIETPNNLSNKEGINIYPNPSNGSFNVKLPPSMVSKNVSIEISDLAGKKLLTVETNGESNIQVDSHALSTGIYQVRVRGQAYVGKLIVQ